jgi:type IV secretion system protein VirB9
LTIDVKILAISIVLALSGLSVNQAQAASDSRSLPVDHRVHVISYQPDQVFRMDGHYRYQSAIEFEKDEDIRTISMGDSSAWMINPSGNRLFLKPIEQDATTNMTVLTNKRTYLFELHAREASDINDANMVFIMRFIYNDKGDGLGRTGLDSVPDIDNEADRSKYNTNYTISGSDAIAPLRIFDDGEFTYFQFPNKNADVPAFFWVDGDNNENVINYRTRGDYIVVERVVTRFTLRHGGEVVCVFNEKRLAENKDIKNFAR